jgi:hypothetical protein
LPEKEMTMNAAGSKFAFVSGLMLIAAPGIANAGMDDWRHSNLNGLLYILAGGGVTDFTESTVRDRFSLGGTWDLRVGLANRFFVGGELAYVGSTRNIDTTESNLLSNGAEAVVRLQYPHVAGDWLLEPFVFGGIGWNRVFIQDAAPGLLDNDDIGMVPFGGGVMLGYGRFLLDARFTYRAAFDENLALALNEAPAKLRQWGVSASVGYEF